jgi:hypothetical protein
MLRLQRLRIPSCKLTVSHSAPAITYASITIPTTTTMTSTLSRHTVRSTLPTIAQLHTQCPRSFWSKWIRPDAPRDIRRPLQPWDTEFQSTEKRPLVGSPHPNGWGALEKEAKCPECWAVAAATAAILIIGLYYTRDDDAQKRINQLLKNPQRELFTWRAMIENDALTLDDKWEQYEMARDKQNLEQQQPGVSSQSSATAVAAATISPPSSSPSSAKRMVVAIPLSGEEGGVCVELASYPRRIIAFIVDILVVQGVLSLTYLLSVRIRPDSSALLKEHYGPTLISLVYAVYEVACAVATDGQTLGKWALGLRLRRKDFAEVSVGLSGYCTNIDYHTLIHVGELIC